MLFDAVDPFFVIYSGIVEKSDRSIELFLYTIQAFEALTNRLELLFEFRFEFLVKLCINKLADTLKVFFRQHTSPLYGVK